MRALLLALALAAIFAPAASAAPAFGCAEPLAALDFPEPRACIETQGWWVQGQTSLAEPSPDFPFQSSHVHLMIPFPVGERVVLTASGGYSWPYLAQFHEGDGGQVRGVRGGAFQFGSCCPRDPGFVGVPIVGENMAHAGEIPEPASIVDQWRAASGKRENRFTADTTSPFGKRQYQSGAWNAYLNAPGACVGITARGWYEGPGYTNVVLKDSNLGSCTGFQASLLQTPVPASWTLTYGLREGASKAFAYIDANIHAGSKGIVLFENRAGSDGSFTVDTSALEPGVHVLLIGGWEKAAAGWNAGVLRVPFLVGG